MKRERAQRTERRWRFWISKSHCGFLVSGLGRWFCVNKFFAFRLTGSSRWSNHRPMRGRILLQDLETHRYFAGEGMWAAGCQQAKVFEHTWMALQEGLNHADRTTQVVWCFGDPSENMYMLVRPYDGAVVYPCGTCPLKVGIGEIFHS